jgi:hypothetical protein
VATHSAGAKRFAPTVQRPSTPHCECRRTTKTSSKDGNSRSLPEGRRDNLQHNKNHARGNISSIPLSEEYSWGLRRKNTNLLL